jgi:diguanylate cyclase (GGDEF)-like protein
MRRTETKKRARRWTGAGYAAIAVFGLLFALNVRIEADHERQAAWRHHLETAQTAAKNRAKDTGRALNEIYQGVRTIGALPSVRRMDRHGAQLGDDGRETIQQTYNNIANNVDVSEVYIVPADFDPAKTDPVTSRPEQPILMFDNLITNGGREAKKPNPLGSRAFPQGGNDLPAEIEIHEFRQLQQQLGWLGKNYPNQAAIEGFQVPMITGAEVMTCDNTDYNVTGKEADRAGLIFSTPFFGEDGKFKGSVSAIILSNALRKLLANQDYTLISPVGGEIHIGSANGPLTRPAASAAGLLPPPNIVLQEEIAISAHDPRGDWVLRANYPAAEFYAGPDFEAIRAFELIQYAVLSAITMIAICLAWVGALGRHAAEMDYRANHDGLTDLPNMRRLRQVISDKISSTDASSKHALLYLDLDRFKLVNDTLGHAAGDALLKAVAKRLLNCIDKNDALARIGGDEFVILQCDIAAPENALTLARRIIAAIAEPFEIGGQQMTVGTSIGIAVTPSDGADPDALLRSADRAMFRAKSLERGSCCFFEPAMDQQQIERNQLKAELEKALSQNELMLHYQPFVNVNTEEITGFEAFLRWDHPTRGLLSPSAFMSIAEDAGFITPIGEWIIREVCHNAAFWPASIRVAVNLSAAQFRSETLPLTILSALKKSGVAPSRLELEITESVLLSDDVGPRDTLNQLQNIGVKVALDKFGTGFSSLSYLRSFKFDKIKIDGSLINGMNGKGVEIIKAIVALGQNFGMTTTAVGVETAKQLRQVRELGCSEAQGFHISRPVAPAEAMKLINKRKSSAA